MNLLRLCGLLFLVYSYSMPATTSEFIHMSRRLVYDASAVLRTYVGISVESCISECKSRTSCHFIQYRVNAHFCVLLKNSSSILPAVSAGYVYGDKAHWDMGQYEECRNCSLNSTCIDNGTSCEITECSYPDLPTFNGNMFAIGDHITRPCNGSLKKTRYVCEANGQWSVTGDACPTMSPSTSTTTTTTTTTPPTSTTSQTSSNIQWHSCLTSSVAFVDLYLSWADAKVYCEIAGAHLVNIDSADMNDCVQTEITLLLGTVWTNLWIGSTDADMEGIFTWSDGSPVAGFTRWSNNEPNNSYGSEDCVALNTNGFLWSDRQCGLSERFICQKDI